MGLAYMGFKERLLSYCILLHLVVLDRGWVGHLWCGDGRNRRSQGERVYHVLLSCIVLRTLQMSFATLRRYNTYVVKYLD